MAEDGAEPADTELGCALPAVARADGETASARTTSNPTRDPVKTIQAPQRVSSGKSITSLERDIIGWVSQPNVEPNPALWKPQMCFKSTIFAP